MVRNYWVGFGLTRREAAAAIGRSPSCPIALGWGRCLLEPPRGSARRVIEGGRQITGDRCQSTCEESDGATPRMLRTGWLCSSAMSTMSTPAASLTRSPRCSNRIVTGRQLVSGLGAEARRFARPGWARRVLAGRPSTSSGAGRSARGPVRSGRALASWRAWSCAARSGCDRGQRL